MVKFYKCEPVNKLHFSCKNSLNVALLTQKPSLKIESVSNNNPKRNNDDNSNNTLKYTKVVVENPYNNRDIILKITKKQKGVYI